MHLENVNYRWMEAVGLQGGGVIPMWLQGLWYLRNQIGYSIDGE